MYFYGKKNVELFGMKFADATQGLKVQFDQLPIEKKPVITAYIAEEVNNEALANNLLVRNDNFWKKLSKSFGLKAIAGLAIFAMVAHWSMQALNKDTSNT